MKNYNDINDVHLQVDGDIQWTGETGFHLENLEGAIVGGAFYASASLTHWGAVFEIEESEHGAHVARRFVIGLPGRKYASAYLHGYNFDAQQRVYSLRPGWPIPTYLRYVWDGVNGKGKYALLQEEDGSIRLLAVADNISAFAPLLPDEGQRAGRFALLKLHKYEA